MKIRSILKHKTVLTDSKSWKSDPSDNEYRRNTSPKYKIKDMSDLSTRDNLISFDDLLANIPPVTEPVAKQPAEELPDEASFKGKDRVVPIRHLNIIMLITSHWQYRQSHRYKNIDDAIKILGDIFELNFQVIAKMPYNTEFLVADGDNYKTVLIKRRTSRFDVFVTKTLLSPHMKTPNIKYIFRESQVRESQGHLVKLGDLVTMSKGMEDADFWIEYRGSVNTVGKPSKKYRPYKLGIKVIATDKLDPRFLYYAFMNLHQQGQFAKLAHGTTNRVNLRIRDLANIPLGNG